MTRTQIAATLMAGILSQPNSTVTNCDTGKIRLVGVTEKGLIEFSLELADTLIAEVNGE